MERLRAARAAIDASGTAVVLTGRAECHLVGHPDPLRESLRRLTAYADAGADCLYAPGIRTREAVAEVVRAVAPKPVNVLVAAPWFTTRELEDLGVRRISVGGALARVALGAALRAAQEIACDGTSPAEHVQSTEARQFSTSFWCVHLANTSNRSYLTFAS